MRMYEAQTLINNSYMVNKQDWEMSRFIGYIIAQVNSTKKLKVSDILQFDWDKEKTKRDTDISNEDIQRLRNKAKQYINNKR